MNTDNVESITLKDDLQIEENKNKFVKSVTVIILDSTLHFGISTNWYAHHGLSIFIVTLKL
jgi:hypothetical protein